MTYQNTIKKFAIVVADNNRFGKSLSIHEAMKIAGVKKGMKYVVYIGLVKPESTTEEVTNIMHCFNVNDMGGISMYNHGSELEKDKEMISRLMIGWTQEVV